MLPLLFFVIGAIVVFVRHYVDFCTKMGTAFINFRSGFRTGELNCEGKRKPKRDLVGERRVRLKNLL